MPSALQRLLFFSSYLAVGLLTFCGGSYSLPEGTSLYVSNSSHILRVSGLDNEEQVILSESIRRAVGLAVDVKDGYLFWTDVDSGQKGIYRATMDGQNVHRIISDVDECNGLTVDWASKHIYWTDAQRRTLEVANYDGTQRKVLVHRDLKKPRGVVADPVNGYMYVGDQDLKKILRYKLDGSERTVLDDTNILWPNQLAISYTLRRVYWADARNKTVESCDFDGSDQRVDVDLSGTDNESPVFGLAISGERAYFSTWFDGCVHAAGVREDGPATVKTLLSEVSTREMFSMAIVDSHVQPPGVNPCGTSNKGGCSHLCLPTGATDYRCACPNEGALVMRPDGSTCTAPTEILLYTEKDRGQVGFIALDWQEDEVAPETYVVARSTRPVAVSYDPVERLVYWSDVKERRLYRADLSGDRKEVFLNATYGIGVVDGLAVDYIHRRLYFANLGQSSPKLDGAVFTWHRIEMIGLDGRGRRTIVTDVDKPRSLQLDLENRYLYYTDWGSQRRVVRTDLDGTNPLVIRSTDLSNPNALALHGSKLHLVDSNFDKKTTAPYIASYNTEQNTWQTVTQVPLKVKIPLGIAAKGDSIFVSDWVTAEIGSGRIISYNTRTGHNRTLLSDLRNPTGLLYTPVYLHKKRSDVCLMTDCSDMCISTPSTATTRYRCLCPDLSTNILDSNGKTCTEPNNFLLMTDLNTIKMVGLDGLSDRNTYTLLYGGYKSNYVGLAYDWDYKTLYWSDLRGKEILSAHWGTRRIRTVYRGESAIDSLAMDVPDQKLLWTFYGENTGGIGLLDLLSEPYQYTTILTGLEKPRAIALDQRNGYVFWTEYGHGSNVPKVGRAYLDGSGNVTIADTDYKWPNALAIYENQLFVADGKYRRVDVMGLDGSNRRELMYLTHLMDHIFGMAVYGNALYFTDWVENRTAVANLKTGQIETIARHLYRPSQLVLHHPTHLTHNNMCLRGEHECSDICIPLPGSYHCTCPVGSKLAADKRTCEKAEVLWEATDDFRCPKTCHIQAYCARLVPTTTFRCICGSGFHGDGQKFCIRCPVDTYKSELSNSTCVPCPRGSNTLGMTASETCYCSDRDARFINGRCVGSRERSTTTITPTTTASTTTVRSSTVAPPTTESSITESSTTQDTATTFGIGLPHFENCPGAVINLVLPLNADKAVLNLNLVARDHRGISLALDSHLPAGAMLEWKGRGVNGYQYLTYTAVDSWGQQAKCTFAVSVIDMQSPWFTACPNNIEMTTHLDAAVVTWSSPQASDNVRVTKIYKTHTSGTEFQSGRVSTVKYVAMDEAGNRAECQFSVKVNKITPKCPLPAKPKGGALVCGLNRNEIWQCHTLCDADTHAHNPTTRYKRLQETGYQCVDSKWLVPFPTDYSERACLVQKPPMLVASATFVYSGPCQPNNEALQQEIVHEVLQRFKDGGICPWDVADLLDLCNSGNLEVTCGEGDRRKRSTSSTVVLKLTITANLSEHANKSYTEEQFDEAVYRIRQLLRGDLQLDLPEQAAYSSVPQRFRLVPPHITCPIGQTKVNETCVLCPAGSVYNRTLLTCDECPSNTYQDQDGQTSCKACPFNTFSDTAAYSIKLCEGVLQSKEQWPLYMIVSILVTVCLIVIILVAVGIYCFMKRTKWQKVSRHGSPVFQPNSQYKNRAFENEYVSEATTSANPRYQATNKIKKQLFPLKKMEEQEHVYEEIHEENDLNNPASNRVKGQEKNGIIVTGKPMDKIAQNSNSTNTLGTRSVPRNYKRQTGTGKSNKNSSKTTQFHSTQV